MNINTPENLEAVRKHYNTLYGKSENNAKNNKANNKNNTKKTNNAKHGMTTRSKAKATKNRKTRKSNRKH